jgi:hypothetical protein
VSASKSPDDAALDALAAALAPRLLRLLREQAGQGDDALEELLAQAGFEIDTEAPAVERVKLAPALRKGRAA